MAPDHSSSFASIIEASEESLPFSQKGVYKGSVIKPHITFVF